MTTTSVARPRRRKPRGSAKDRKALYVEIDPATLEKIEAVADALRCSKVGAIELMLSEIAVDAAGRPHFWDGPLPSELEEELPLPSAS